VGPTVPGSAGANGGLLREEIATSVGNDQRRREGENRFRSGTDFLLEQGDRKGGIQGMQDLDHGHPSTVFLGTVSDPFDASSRKTKTSPAVAPRSQPSPAVAVIGSSLPGVEAGPKLTAFSHSAGLPRGPPTDASPCFLCTYFSDPGHRGLTTR
jgi:hypothetical protein